MAKSLLSAVLRHLGLRNSNWNLRNEHKRQAETDRNSRILSRKRWSPVSYSIESAFSALIGCRSIRRSADRPYTKLRLIRGIVLFFALPRFG